MNIRARVNRLEAERDKRRPLADMSDDELEECIAALLGLEKGEPVTDEMLVRLLNAAEACNLVPSLLVRADGAGGWKDQIRA